ncbi:unnamed protein product [Brassicogethes aeneus]|uniref:Uncharacterized protein n=1 Tax=Brassicogethes aeneus TaxID=1431903 RepID=A0A9P0B669_BRAAE|nr:unnamed protein product [Brassicogethes aeneus]
MAYVNVKDWSVDQVTDWIKGLDNTILKYAASFLNNGVTGHQLLNLRAEDLEHLGVKTLGHQEIILEAVEHLRNFHYELDKENLQMLALRLSCTANSLFKGLLLLDDSAKLTNQIMNDVHNIINAVKPLACWLDRSPFAGDKEYIENKEVLLKSSIEMATVALRDIFSKDPIRTIRQMCEQLSKRADYIIQVISDPMILQPASLDLATLKKKEQELGFFIMPCNHAIHQICDIKYGYPAHSCNKIENGDEIVQVNYQTVAGWHRKNVMILIQESPPEIVLTLKKRPRHTKVYGQIYMKPYRLPSRKRGGQNWFRWNDNLPSPRLMPIHDLPQLSISKLPLTVEPVDKETVSSSDSEPSDGSLDGESRMYPLKPRPILQRRNTITGVTPTSKRPYLPIEYWELYKPNNSSTDASSLDIIKMEESFLRDKSVSCNIGLDKRPTTVIGLGKRNTSFKKSSKDKNKKKVNFEESNIYNKIKSKQEENKENSFINLPATNLDLEKSISINSISSLQNENISFIDEGRELTDRTSMAMDSKVFEEVNNDMPNKEANSPSIKQIIRIFDNQNEEKSIAHKPKIAPRSNLNKPPEVPKKPKPLVPPRIAIKPRVKLDKSHSTPAYDLTEEPNSENILAESSIILDKPIDVSPINEECAINIIRENIENNNFRELNPLPECSFSTNDDLPPKPPPRNIDVQKPAYPADSPKPQNLLNLAKSQNPRLDNFLENQVFEFPEPKTNSTNTGIQQTGMLIGKLVCDEKPQKYFESKKVATPITKEKIIYNEINAPLPKNNLEVQKPLEEEKSNNQDLSKSFETQKGSPTNSIVKIISTKSKYLKKKNSLVAKRRKVSVNDLNPCETQGFLYQRLRGKNSVHWNKRWFVLYGNSLYGFKSKEDHKAACLIFLSGYTVAVANEVKSRSHAFKVYHTGTVFYFSANDMESEQTWIELIKAATMQSDRTKSSDAALYSETDESDTEKKVSLNEKIDPFKKFGSLKKFSSKKSNEDQSGSTSLDRKWFFKSNVSNSSKNSVPVPTAQFRSYRKIKNDFNSITTGNFTSHVSLFSGAVLPSSQNISVPNLTIETIPISESDQNHKLQKNNSINYMHASNPSLCNISEFNVPIFSKNSLLNPPHSNFQGFMTLEELMEKENEQRKQNPHIIAEEMTRQLTLIKPDVVYGEVPIKKSEKVKDSLKSLHSRGSTLNVQNSEKKDTSCFGKRLGSLKKSHSKEKYNFDNKTSTYPKSNHKNKDENDIYDYKLNRSLPRQHKMQESHIDKYVHSSSEKCIPGKFNDRSYEMIFCPETINDVQFAQNRSLDENMYYDTTKKHQKLKKQNSFSSTDKKSKINIIKYGAKIGDSSTNKLKSAIQYTPMSLPLSQDPKSKPKFAFELNLDDKTSKSGKFNKILGGKSDSKKEKTFFGSPKLHRAIFKKNDSKSEINWLSSSPPTLTMPESYELENASALTEPVSVNISPQADYPGLRYPPVFEPETYSLSNPLSLSRKPTINRIPDN